MAGRVFQLNIKPETVGERGLPKRRVGSVFIERSGVQGDFNRYRHEEIHDDPDSAVLLIPFETLRELNSEGWPVQPGDLGENVTTLGIPYGDFAPGKAYRVGGAEVQISRPCNPCENLYLLPYVGRQEGPSFLKAMRHRRGWYARVLKEGRVAMEDAITSILVRPLPPRSARRRPRGVGERSRRRRPLSREG